MTETQQSICTWADSTFGPASDASIAARALVEMAELVTACVNGEPAERIGEEIADVVIVLARLGRALSIDVVSMACESTWSSPVGVVLYAQRARRYLRRIVDNGDIDVDRFGTRRDMIDVIQVLAQAAREIDVDLPAAIDRKMAINRTRRWVVDGKGHGRHVKEGQ